MKMATKEINRDTQITAIPLYDAHCHLDMLSRDTIGDAVRSNVLAMVTNGTSFAANMENMKLVDERNVFVNLGIDPEFAKAIKDDELEFMLRFIADNRDRIVGIGEIGLDKTGDDDNYGRQKLVFGRMLDLSVELNKPVSIHSRNAIGDVLEMLSQRNNVKAHIHFFEGGPEHARTIEKMGYMVSVPPVENARRRKAIREIPIDNIMVESDAPAAAKSPKEVITALRIVAETKGISIERAAEAVASNTKRFFMLNARNHMMRY